MSDEAPELFAEGKSDKDFQTIDKAFKWIGRSPVTQVDCYDVAMLKSNFAVAYHNLRRRVAELENRP